MADLEHTIATLSAQATPVRTAMPPRYQVLLWLLGATIYVGLLTFCFGVRDDIARKAMSIFYVIEITLLILMSITALFSVAILSFPDLYQKRWAAFTPLFSGLMFTAILAIEYTTDKPPSPIPGHGMECLLCIACYALVPACWIFYRLRRMATVHGAMAGGVATLGAWSIGSLVLRLSEPTDSIIHLLEWHYMPMLVASTAGMILGNRLLKW